MNLLNALLPASYFASLGAKGLVMIDKQVLKNCHHFVNPITPMSDQDRICPHNIHTISSRQVMRIKRNINYGISR